VLSIFGTKFKGLQLQCRRYFHLKLKSKYFVPLLREEKQDIIAVQETQYKEEELCRAMYESPRSQHCPVLDGILDGINSKNLLELFVSFLGIVCSRHQPRFSIHFNLLVFLRTVFKRH
jgi:hypothetical protein